MRDHIRSLSISGNATPVTRRITQHITSVLTVLYVKPLP